tara:strand:- start:987 stop:1187 length:201 start_codon:yes stop_codon:yes gene_type:complete
MKGQYSAVAANSKVLMRLIGLDHQQVNHNIGFKHGRSTTFNIFLISALISNKLLINNSLNSFKFIS